jgi:chromosome segregation ATPase
VQLAQADEKAELEKQVKSQAAEIAALADQLRLKRDAATGLEAEVGTLRERVAALGRQADEARAAATEARKSAADADERAAKLTLAAGVPTSDMVLSAEVVQARHRLASAERQVRGLGASLLSGPPR